MNQPAMTRAHLFCLICAVLLGFQRFVAGADPVDLSLKADELEVALDEGKWRELRFVSLTKFSEPIGVILRREGGKAIIETYCGNKIGQGTPISPEKVAAIIAEARKHHRVASAPMGDAALSEQDERSRKFARDYAPSIHITVANENISRSRQVIFHRDFAAFAEWLATVVRLAPDRAKSGTAPEEVNALVRGPWETLEVGLSYFDYAKACGVGFRYKREAGRIHVVSYHRSGTLATEAKHADLGEAELPTILNDVTKHYTAAFNEHDEQEESLDERAAWMLRYQASCSRTGFLPENCGGVMDQPSIVVKVTGPEGERSIKNAFVFEGVIDFWSYMDRYSPAPKR
jgi:hypothetical protein